MTTLRLANPAMILLSATATALLTVFASGSFFIGGSALAQGLSTDDPPVNFRVTSYDHAFINIAWGVPRDRGITNYTLKLYEHDGNEFVLLASRDSETNGGIEYSGSRVVEPDTQYKYVLMLKNDSGTTIIEASVSVRTLTLTRLTLTRLTLTRLTLTRLTLTRVSQPMLR